MPDRLKIMGNSVAHFVAIIAGNDQICIMSKHLVFCNCRFYFEGQKAIFDWIVNVVHVLKILLFEKYFYLQCNTYFSASFYALKQYEH